MVLVLRQCDSSIGWGVAGLGVCIGCCCDDILTSLSIFGVGSLMVCGSDLEVLGLRLVV